MKRTLQYRVKMISKNLLYGIVLQCLVMSTLMAHDLNAQVKPIDKNFLRLQKGEWQLQEVFKTLQTKTDYVFIYPADILEGQPAITLDNKKKSVNDVLSDIARSTGLKFKQVDNSIYVGELKKEEKPEDIPIEVEPIEIKGRVTDQNGAGIPGATVLIDGTTSGTATDIDGNFSIDAPEGSVLLISFIGYTSQRVTVGSQSVINVVLEEDLSSLEEVVVVGYGTQKKSDITGAISSISSRDLSETPAGNVMEQAQGRLAGVDIVRSNGSPGASVQIRIRGNRSINASNDPLFVIDGIPTSANINDFNPNDIESMEVLKDASAVAIYGSRGANGVVLITTKKGTQGPPVITYNGYYGIKNPVENIDLMDGDEFASYIRIAHGLSPEDNSRDAAIMSPHEAENLQNRNITDWLSLIIGSGTQQEHQISVSGGTEGIQYYLSGSYFDEKGIISNTDYSRYSVRANINANLSEKLRVGLSSTVSNDIRNQMRNEPYNNALIYSPLTPPYDEEGNIPAYPNQRTTATVNPILYLQPNQYENETRSYRVFANIYADYALHENLSYRVNFGPDLRFSRQGIYTGSMDESINTGSIQNRNIFAYTLENILTFNKRYGDHSLDAVGLFSTQNSRTEFALAAGQDIPLETSYFYGLGGAATLTNINSGLSKWGLLSYMGRINYQFKNRYLFTVTGRSDGSSRLAEGRKWAFFPSLALGWIISEEDFLINSPIPYLKLRAGYGEVGNTSINPYQTMGGLGRTSYAFGEDQGFGFGQQSIPNPDLGWEISQTINVGLDFGFFDNRLTGSLEFYNTNTKDLLLNRLIPITSGYSSILQNIGATRNRGFELSASTIAMDNKEGLKWDIDLNFFTNKEEIRELFDGQSDDVGNQWFIGQPINVFYSFKQEGIWQNDEADLASQNNQSPGDIKIADVNGRDAEGNLTKQPDGIINADDRTVLGSTVPKWSGGITNRLSYRGIDFSFLVYARQGQMLRSGFHYLGSTSWQGRTNKLNFDYWTPDNPSNEIPIPKASTAPLYFDAVHYFDGSFIKVRNISLGYSFNNELIERLGLTSFRIYATANNAFTFSKYKVVDPETSNGIVGGNNPLTTATYIFGLNFKF